jgi:uncharacterized membrane protein required for colicin V production
MLLGILKQFNWLDIFIVFLLLKITYVSVKNGFVVELFKLLGTVSSVYISFHYFTAVSDLLMKRVSEEQGFPVDFMDFLVCLLLIVAVYLLFTLLRIVVCHFVKMEAVPALSKWGGFILGIARGIIASSLVILMLFISTIGYLSASAKSSYIGQRIFNVSISTYEALWNGVMHKFVSGEKFNGTVRQVQQEYFAK